MILIYYFQNNTLNKAPLEINQPIPENALWIDLINPTKEEENFIENTLNIEIPNPEEISQIQVSSCFYCENSAYYLTAKMSTQLIDEEITVEGITFILKDKILITTRYFEPQSFKYISSQINKFSPDKLKPIKILINLLESAVYYVSDVLEKVGKDINNQTSLIFRSKQKLTKISKKYDFKTLLKQIGNSGDTVAKTRESLLSINRLLNYIRSHEEISLDSNYTEHLSTLIQDIAALNDHASFLSNKINFLLDATLGMINIEQNNIIKIFSVAAVAFLPPTLIASIYGMNFEFMPELHWKFGYPFAFGLMLFSAWVPFRFFKKKGWL